MSRTRRRRTYQNEVRTRNYHPSHRTARRSEPESLPTQKRWWGYRAPTQFRYASPDTFMIDYPTYKASGSQAPLELIMKKRRARRNQA